MFLVNRCDAAINFGGGHSKVSLRPPAPSLPPVSSLSQQLLLENLLDGQVVGLSYWKPPRSVLCTRHCARFAREQFLLVLDALRFLQGVNKAFGVDLRSREVPHTDASR